MLIDYSIRSFEVLERKLTEEEKVEVFDVFYRVGLRMGISGLPQGYSGWLNMRNEHLKENLINSKFSKDLYKQYRKHLGWLRFQLLIQAQVLVVPNKVNKLLNLGSIPYLKPVIKLYKIVRFFHLETILKNLILPRDYKTQIKDLDVT